MAHGRKKCPREGTRLQYVANPASHSLYSNPPSVGEVGTVVSLGRRTCTGGHAQDLVYADWPSVGTMGVARADVVPVKSKGPKQMQVNGPVVPMEPKAQLLRDYEEAVRRYVRGTGSQADLSKHATAAIMGGCSTDRLKEIRDRVQRELIAGDFSGLGAFSVGQRVIVSGLGPGRVTTVRGIHVGVQLDTGAFTYANASSVEPTGEKQRYFSGNDGGMGEIIKLQMVASKKWSNADIIEEVKLKLGPLSHVFVVWRGPGPWAAYDLADVEVMVNDRSKLNEWQRASYVVPSVRPGKLYNILASERRYQGGGVDGVQYEPVGERIYGGE